MLVFLILKLVPVQCVQEVKLSQVWENASLARQIKNLMKTLTTILSQPANTVHLELLEVRETSVFHAPQTTSTTRENARNVLRIKYVQWERNTHFKNLRFRISLK